MRVDLPRIVPAVAPVLAPVGGCHAKGFVPGRRLLRNKAADGTAALSLVREHSKDDFAGPNNARCFRLQGHDGRSRNAGAISAERDPCRATAAALLPQT